MKTIKVIHQLSSEKGILALINPRKRKVLLVRSTDALVSLSRIMKGIKSRNKRYRELRKDYRSLEIKLVDPDNSRLTFQYWVSKYLSEGYTLYSQYNAIKYRLRVDVTPQPDYLATVKLISSNGSEVVLGLFSTMGEANEFVKYSYPNLESITSLTYALNSLSKEYFRKGTP